MAERYADPGDPLNGPKYHTGKPCIERGCNNPAGTGWSPFWCQPCNAKRMDRISASLEQMVREFDDTLGVPGTFNDQQEQPE